MQKHYYKRVNFVFLCKKLANLCYKDFENGKRQGYFSLLWRT